MLSSGDVALRMVAACNTADWHVAESLLDLYGAEAAHVRGIGQYDATPLHAAAATGQLPLLQQLLRAGAMVDAPARLGFTPLFMAARNNRPAACALLLAAGADPDAPAAATAPLLVAADAGFAPVVAALLRAGASVFAVDHHGDTALHLACANRFSSVASMLVDAGAQPDVLNALGVTPLQLAEESADLDLLHIITSPNLPLTLSEPYGAVTPYQSDMYALDVVPPASSYALDMYHHPYSAETALMPYTGYAPNAMDRLYPISPYSSRYYASAYGPYAMDPYSRSTMDRYGLDRYWPVDHLASDRLSLQRHTSAFGRYGLIDSYHGPTSSHARYASYSPYNMHPSYSPYGVTPYDPTFGAHAYGVGKYPPYGAGRYPAYGRYSMYDRMGHAYDSDPYYRSRSMAPALSEEWGDHLYGAAYGYDDEYHNRGNHLAPYGTYRYGAYGSGGASWRGRHRLSSRERHRMSTYRNEQLADMIGAFACRSMSPSERNRFMNRLARNAHRYRISGSTLLSDRYAADTLARMLVTDSSGNCRNEHLWATAEFIRSFRAGGSYAY